MSKTLKLFRPELSIVECVALSGVVRLGAFEDAGHDIGVLISEVERRFGTHVVTGDGWLVVPNEGTVAVRTVLRISGAFDTTPVPVADIGKAIQKMIVWGEYVPGVRRYAEEAKVVRELFDDYPSEEVVAVLCGHIGGLVRGGRVDFSVKDCNYISPTLAIEKEILLTLQTNGAGYATSSWLARHLDDRPSRTGLDYTILPSIPFVLKDDKAPVRLLGREASRSDGKSVETYVNMRRTADSRRVILEFRVNEEAVEGNSFNIPPQCRPFAHGEFVEVNTGKKLWFDQFGRDARKFQGLGVVIRALYPNYVAGETCYVVIDRDTNEASVEVGIRYHGRFEERANSLLQTGITPRESSLPKAA